MGVCKGYGSILLGYTIAGGRITCGGGSTVYLIGRCIVGNGGFCNFIAVIFIRQLYRNPLAGLYAYLDLSIFILGNGYAVGIVEPVCSLRIAVLVLQLNGKGKGLIGTGIITGYSLRQGQSPYRRQRNSRIYCQKVLVCCVCCSIIRFCIVGESISCRLV
jgi:hypothetical protein